MTLTGSIQELDFESLNKEIKRTMRRSAKDAVQLGFMLRRMLEEKLWTARFSSFDEYLDNELHIGYSMATRFIGINKKYSLSGNSMEMKEEYLNYSQGLLIEMLNMAPELEKKITPDMTVRQARELKMQDRKGRVTDNSGKEQVIDGNYREIEEPEIGPEKIATSQTAECEENRDKAWFVKQYVKTQPKEAGELYKICLREKNNSDRAGAVQKYIAPYGYHCTSCREYDFQFRGFSAGVYLRFGSENVHLKYGRFVIELMKIMGAEIPADIALEPVPADNQEPSDESEEQTELPVLKNPNQRKEWLRNYQQWGLWYRDENIDVNYYKYDFPEGSRLVVAEYPKRHNYWTNALEDEYYFHLLEKNKEGYSRTYDESYRHKEDNETHLIDFLKKLQKGEN